MQQYRHELHKPSLLIALGLAPLPPRVVEQTKHHGEEPYVASNCEYTAGERENIRCIICDAIDAEPLLDTTLLAKRLVQEGHRVALGVLQQWIRAERRKKGHTRVYPCDNLAIMALQGATREEAQAAFPAISLTTVLLVYAALGIPNPRTTRRKKIPKVRDTLRRRVLWIKERYYQNLSTTRKPSA